MGFSSWKKNIYRFFFKKKNLFIFYDQEIILKVQRFNIVKRKRLKSVNDQFDATERECYFILRVFEHATSNTARVVFLTHVVRWRTRLR